jgi:hypothetical protein
MLTANPVTCRVSKKAARLIQDLVNAAMTVARERVDDKIIDKSARYAKALIKLEDYVALLEEMAK